VIDLLYLKTVLKTVLNIRIDYEYQAKRKKELEPSFWLIYCSFSRRRVTFGSSLYYRNTHMSLIFIILKLGIT